MWVLMIVLASCQDVADETAPGEAVTFAPGYPSLHTVPPRPQLSYTVEQRSAIVDRLIADRDNARYTDEVVRYRAGLSSVPPPAPPALAAVPPEPEMGAPDAAHAPALPRAEPEPPAVDSGTDFNYGDDDLGSFMDNMVKGRAAPPAPVDRGANGPEAQATPPDTRVIRASAARAPVSPATTYHGRAPVVTLAMPPDMTHLPLPSSAPPQKVVQDAPRKALPPPPVETTLAGQAPGEVGDMPSMAPPVAGRSVVADASADGAPPAPAPADPDLVGRAPGVVWGMPDMAPSADPPVVVADASMDEPPAPAPVTVDTNLAGHAPGVVWGIPDRAPPAAPSVVADASMDEAPAPAGPPVHSSLAGRAPGVVWGIPDPAPAPLEPPAATDRTRVAAAETAPRPAPLKPAAPEMVLAGEVAPPAPARQVSPPAPAPAKPALPIPGATVLAGQAPDRVAAASTVADARDVPSVEADALHAPEITVASAPAPAPAKPPADGHAPQADPVSMAAAGQSRPEPAAATAGIDVASGLVAIDAAFDPAHDAALGSVRFGAESALLTPDAIVRLAQLLAGTADLAARIKIVGEADAPALALDRALAVGLALVQGGVPADRLELMLGHRGSGDQAWLFLAAPEL
jgi:hypothetical protein